MIRGLAIETSGRIGSVALVRDGAVLSRESFEHGLRHAARIVPAIDALCREAGWAAGDLDEIYVSAGPGSFTGLRIGITLAKTLAFAADAKIVQVPTVRVLAENAPPESRQLIIVLDAKRDQIFTASFQRDQQDWTQLEPAHLGTLGDMLSRAPRPVYLLGEGIPYHEKFIPRDDPGVIVTPAEIWPARAEVVASLGWMSARAGSFIDPMQLNPIYIRRPEAEEKFDAGRK